MQVLGINRGQVEPPIVFPSPNTYRERWVFFNSRRDDLRGCSGLTQGFLLYPVKQLLVLPAKEFEDLCFIAKKIIVFIFYHVSIA